MTAVPSYVRARGEIRASFLRAGERTMIGNLHETGGLRLRFPTSAPGCEAVIVNTGGGVAGGDRQSVDVHAEVGAQVTVTTQSAEKIYRADAEAAEISLSLRARGGSALAWLPQETIMFAGARLRRRLDADVAADATLTIVESLVFGRLAMGEVVTDGELRDRWRVRRDGALVFAEELRIDGAVAQTLDRPAIGRAARATATLLHVAPDAETRLEPFRDALRDAQAEWGASAWNGMLVARFVSPSPEHQRAAIVTALGALLGKSAPRVWQ